MGTKRALWERLRSHFWHFLFQSMQHLYQVVLYDLAKNLPAPTLNTGQAACAARPLPSSAHTPIARLTLRARRIPTRKSSPDPYHAASPTVSSLKTVVPIRLTFLSSHPTRYLSSTLPPTAVRNSLQREFLTESSGKNKMQEVVLSVMRLSRARAQRPGPRTGTGAGESRSDDSFAGSWPVLQQFHPFNVYHREAIIAPSFVSVLSLQNSAKRRQDRAIAYRCDAARQRSTRRRLLTWRRLTRTYDEIRCGKRPEWV